MKIEKVPIKSLIPDPANIRKHSDKNIKAIKGSLLRFGQRKPIVVTNNNIVAAGNGTLEAAIQLGWEDIEIVRTDLEGAELVAFCIADNRTTDLSEFDLDELKDQLNGLIIDGVDLDAIGFDLDDLAALNEGFDNEEEEPKDEKELELPDKKFEILITLKDETDQKKLFDELTERKLQCVIL